jgi:hypothetical protein
LSTQLSTKISTVVIDRHWWYRFLGRHPGLTVRRCDSREAARAEVRREQTTPYLDALTDVLSHPHHPDLIINMDESGFTTRPLKGIQKNCVFSRDRSTSPRFLETQEGNHVTLVGAVTRSGTALVPLLLSTRQNLPVELASSYVGGEFYYFHTPKGYLTGLAMDYWVDTVLLPYVIAVRTRFTDRFTCVLILDGLRSHSTPHTQEIFRDQDIRVIDLPPHTTHLYQPLDLCIFGISKKEYRISGEGKTDLVEKISKKIERILKSWHRACYRGNIIASWRAGGFVYTFRGGAMVEVAINRTLMTTKIAI